MNMFVPESLPADPDSTLQAANGIGSFSSALSSPDIFPSPEIYRQIFTALTLPADRGAVIGITSSMAGEGRSTIATGLARTLAADLDTTVLLVDANLESPSLATYLGTPASPGLGGVLRGKASLAEAMCQVAERLFVIAGRDPEVDSARLLRKLSEHDPFERRRELGALTILDLPAMLTSSYSSLAASTSDAVVLVIRTGVTPMDAIRAAAGRLTDCHLQGAVLNGTQPERRSRRHLRAR